MLAVFGALSGVGWRERAFRASPHLVAVAALVATNAGTLGTPVLFSVSRAGKRVGPARGPVPRRVKPGDCSQAGARSVPLAGQGAA